MEQVQSWALGIIIPVPQGSWVNLENELKVPVSVSHTVGLQ